MKKLQAMLRQANEQLERTARERQELEDALQRSTQDTGHQVPGPDDLSCHHHPLGRCLVACCGLETALFLSWPGAILFSLRE